MFVAHIGPCSRRSLRGVAAFIADQQESSFVVVAYNLYWMTVFRCSSRNRILRRPAVLWFLSLLY